MSLYTPWEITQKTEEVWVLKSSNSFRRTLVLGYLWGMFVAMWAAFSVNTITWLGWVVPFWIMKLLAWITFCLWLILVILAGWELFTWNVLLVISLLQKKITFKRFMKNLSAVWIGNLLWALTIVLLLVAWKWHLYDGGNTASLLLAISEKKLHLDFFQALSLAILCNIYVCFAIWICYSWKTATDKILASIFPIAWFAAIWFEHIVANMFYLSYGFILNFMSEAPKTEIFNFSNLMINNAIPVTLWNFIGWTVFVWLIYWLLFLKFKKS